MDQFDLPSNACSTLIASFALVSKYGIPPFDWQKVMARLEEILNLISIVVKAPVSISTYHSLVLFHINLVSKHNLYYSKQQVAFHEALLLQKENCLDL
jgi:hypothetical protein